MILWRSQLIYRVVPVKRMCVVTSDSTTATISEEAGQLLEVGNKHSGENISEDHSQLA